LATQERFRRKCIEAINKYPNRLKQNAWEGLIQHKLETCEEVEAPKDAGQEGQVWAAIEKFCLSHLRTDNKEDLLAGRVWDDAQGERLYFRSNDLIRYLSQSGLNITERKCWLYISNRGGGYEEFTLKKHLLHCWFIPTIDKPDELTVPEIQEEL